MRSFAEDSALSSPRDAKDFCLFLSAHTAEGVPLVQLSRRRPWQVDRLREVITLWRGPTKHAAWLLVQTATYGGVLAQARQRARAIMLELLADDAVSAYGRYRIMHHLLKQRRRRTGEIFRLVDQLTAPERQAISDLIPEFLGAPAFELNLIALFAARIFRMSEEAIRHLVAEHCRHGL